ncbi:MAG: RnfABCDGE type electron transport complex subunit G [Deltaproteobacteria bacterium]|nr:RnfABCDGE type electron transport complex subunit G [Deltaproteobacteria bacterium]
MREMMKLFIVIVIFSSLSGGVLAAIQNATKDRIEYQQLKFVKGPAINEILKGSTNNPITDRFKVTDNGEETTVFVGVFDGKPNVVALESFGKGFGGDIGVVVGVNIDTDEIVGVEVTTHSETPGVGSRAKTDASFTEQFEGLPVQDPFKVKADGGQIDALSGATISSRGVCGAVGKTSARYQRIKTDIAKGVKALTQ